MFTVATLLPLFLTLTGKIADLVASKSGKTSKTISDVMLLAQQAGAVAELTERLKSEGRDESTEEEAADLQAVLDRETIEDQRFDKNLIKAASDQSGT